MLVVSDQILRGNRYLGNVYPSVASDKHREQIIDITKRLGDHLSRQGYRGLFGCDFLINKGGDIVVVDLNPRRQGGYVCNALALKSVGVDLLELELVCALDKNNNLKINYEKIQYPKAWAHSKIMPYESGQFITRELKDGDMQRAFLEGQGEYDALFYEKGLLFIDGYIGYTVAVGSKREVLYEQVVSSADKLLDTSLSITDPTLS